MPQSRASGEEYFHYQVPSIIEHYRACTGGIDHHNLLRQDLLGMERNFHTHSWWIRFFTTMLSMIIVNAFLAYGYFFPMQDYKVTHLVDFTQRLCAALAGCPLSAPKRKRGAAAAATPASAPDDEEPIGPSQIHHLGSLNNHEEYKGKATKQLHCGQCGRRSSYYCKTCRSRHGTTMGLCDADHKNGECLRLHSESAC